MQPVRQILGDYEILEELGSGGMGVVYRARDVRLGRMAAIKVISAERIGNAQHRARFLREAQSASALNHPNIVTIYRIGSEAGTDFIAMEYVPGQPLSQVIARKPVPLKTALSYAIQIADAMAAAHRAGIVHRDLKPANIIVTPDHHLKVLDFGLAKTIQTGPSSEADTQPLTAMETAEGTIAGTVAYMSPEQAQAQPVDARSDIFSFGAVLYEAVTGRRAFTGENTASTLAAILRDDPAPVAELVQGVPRQLERVVARCLKKDPGSRFQNASDLKAALEDLTADIDSAVRAHPLPPPSRNRWFGQLTGGLRQRVVAVLALLLAVLGITWLENRRSRPSPNRPSRPAVIMLMDTPAPMGVYDPTTRRDSGTNADDLTAALSAFPASLHKETIGSTWDREDQVVKQSPDLIVIHRSAFFHSMNAEFQFGYPPFDNSPDLESPTGQPRSREYLFGRLYVIADGKLNALLGYVGICNPGTKFLVYARGEPGLGWAEEGYRQQWVKNLERRFPALKGRVFTMNVEGGMEKGTFRDANTASEVRRIVRSILNLKPSDATQ